MRSITVNNNDGGQRLDKFLSKTFRALPAALMYKFLRKKRIKVNGKRAEGGLLLSEGDLVELYIPDEFFESAPGKETVIAKPRLNIIYEDDNIIILSKKPGQLVHEGDGGDDADTLILHLKSYLIGKGEYVPEEENSFAPALCNRIDRNTGGIVIAAKNAHSLREMNEMIKSSMIDKRYLCAVHGKPEKNSAVLEAHLFKNTKTKTVRVSAEPSRGSKPIKTGYKVIDYNGELDLALLEVRLYTGRTHQIRAHMEYLGHPLLGEGKYGHSRDDKRLSYRHQALYSYKLRFLDGVGELSYLSGKEFIAPADKINFLEFFNKNRFGGLFSK